MSIDQFTLVVFQISYFLTFCTISSCVNISAQWNNLMFILFIWVAGALHEIVVFIASDTDSREVNLVTEWVNPDALSKCEEKSMIALIALSRAGVVISALVLNRLTNSIFIQEKAIDTLKTSVVPLFHQTFRISWRRMISKWRNFIQRFWKTRNFFFLRYLIQIIDRTIEHVIFLRFSLFQVFIEELSFRIF